MINCGNEMTDFSFLSMTKNITFKMIECFLSDSIFVVDRFHWINHKACSSGHCADSYSALQGLNTEAVEQRHAMTLKIRKMLSYMNPKNFMNFLKIFNWFQNGRVLGANATQYSEHFEQFRKMFL